MSLTYPGGFITKSPTAPTSSAAPGVWTLDQAMQYTKAGDWPTPPQPDPYFNQVSMLLPGNGTNGAQNKTFLDSSTNGFTVTRNGEIPQGTFSPFSQADGYWGNYLTGTNDRFTIPSTSGVAFGTGDFTIEFWLWTEDISNSTQRGVCQISGTSGGLSTSYTNGLNIAIGNPDTGNMRLNIDGSNIATAAGLIKVGTWYHMAFVRSSGTAKIFINGVQRASGSLGGNITGTYLVVGGYYSTSYLMKGNLSNFRIVKGTAVYTSDFTPPTDPLTAISGTELLTCQSNRFMDNSANGFAITTSGAPSVQPFSPFLQTAAYDPAVNGGSAYLDGSDDTYLSVPYNSAFNFSACTVEAWVYMNSGGGGAIAYEWDASNGFAFYIDSTNFQILFETSTGRKTAAYSGSYSFLTWHHVAFSWTGSDLNLYLNGTRLTTVSAGGTYDAPTAVAINIGRNSENNSYEFSGYISDFRIHNTALYTGATYTVPTAPLTATSGTQLLLSCTNAGVVDYSAKNTINTLYNAQISTAQSKFGGSSIYFDGTGDVLFSPDNPMWVLNNTFTIEAWIYPTTLNSYNTLISQGDITGWYFSVRNGSLQFYNFNTSQQIDSASSAFTTNQWTHVAFVANNGTGQFYINGTASGSSGSITIENYSAGIYVGYQGTTYYPFTGYINDLRVTNGVARYTSSFTPPASAFPLY